MQSQELITKVTSILQSRNKLHHSYFWVADVFYQRGVVAAITKPYDDDLRAVLLMHVRHSITDFSFEEVQPGKYVYMKNWHDPVHESLQAINILPERDNRSLEDDPRNSLSFNITVSTMKTWATFRYMDGPIEDRAIATLWRSLHSAIHDIAQAYNDPKIMDWVASMR